MASICSKRSQPSSFSPFIHFEIGDGFTRGLGVASYDLLAAAVALPAPETSKINL